MESLIGLWGIITFIVGLIAFIAIVSIAENTRKTNILLRKILKEQKPDDYEINVRSTRIWDKKTGKKY